MKLQIAKRVLASTLRLLRCRFSLLLATLSEVKVNGEFQEAIFSSAMPMYYTTHVAAVVVIFLHMIKVLFFEEMRLVIGSNI